MGNKETFLELKLGKEAAQHLFGIVNQADVPSVERMVDAADLLAEFHKAGTEETKELFNRDGTRQIDRHGDPATEDIMVFPEEMTILLSKGMRRYLKSAIEGAIKKANSPNALVTFPGGVAAKIVDVYTKL